MFKALLQKQLLEVFRGYFFDSKKKKVRSKGAVIGMFILYALLMVGVLGGLFTFLALTLCGPLTEAGMGWLYFLIFSAIAILLGAFGSIFSTYSSLYLAKDNDLLLSMPIPIRDIVASRLTNVFLMGALYAGLATIPGTVVYWISTRASLGTILCGLLLMLLIAMIVMVLSCLLGWCVAKLSLKLKHKSFASTALSIIFVGLYYFFYAKAQTLIQDLVENVATYGTRIKDAAHGLYLFGRMGEGDGLSALLFFGAGLVLMLLTWLILKSTFLSIATASGASAKVKYKEKRASVRTPFRALVVKEFNHFTSSSNYMLNCGLGILLLPAAAVLLLINGGNILPLISLAGDDICVYAAALLSLMGCMINAAAPSVSLEGKSIWLIQSLPVSTGTVLRAKAAFQMILSVVPMLFVGVCFAILLPVGTIMKVLLVVNAIVFTVFFALFSAFLGTAMCNLNWTNEITPIKQSAAVAVSIFGGWFIAIIQAVLYLLVKSVLSPVWYMTGWMVLLIAASIFMRKWLDTKGAEKLSAL